MQHQPHVSKRSPYQLNIAKHQRLVPFGSAQPTDGGYGGCQIDIPESAIRRTYSKCATNGDDFHRSRARMAVLADMAARLKSHTAKSKSPKTGRRGSSGSPRVTLVTPHAEHIRPIGTLPAWYNLAQFNTDFDREE
jgi:hypothetical protein